MLFDLEEPQRLTKEQAEWEEKQRIRGEWDLRRATVDGYLQEGPRSTDWLARGVIKQHRTMATYINMLLRLGFSISEVNEWGPKRRQIASQPGWADERKRPAFLLVGARR